MNLILQEIDALILKYSAEHELAEDLSRLKTNVKEYQVKEQEKSLREKALYSSLLDNLPEMDVYLFDHNLQFILTGGKEKLKYGYKEDEFTGELIEDVSNEYFNDILLPLCRDTVLGDFQQTEIRYKGKYYKVITQPIKNDLGLFEYGILISHNITRLKKIQNKLKKAKEEAENIAKAKSLFLANMSHEIRTPLNAIIGFSEQLSKTTLTRKQAHFNELVNEASDHLLSLVSEILILLKIGMGKVYIEAIPFDLRKVYIDVYEFFYMRAKKKSIDFSFEVDDSVPDVLIGDPFRLKQVLINLIGNAIKFTEKGFVRFSCVTQKGKKDKIRLLMTIKDSGIGFSKEDASFVFDEFTQASNMIRERHGGTGLGLTISKKLIELQKGKISVNSVVNKGTCFTVTLPYQIGSADDLEGNDNNLIVSNNFLQGKHILLADDDPYNRELANIVFNKWGVDLELAKDGGEALELVQYKKFDIILLDIHMPHADGIQVSKYIRSEEDCPNKGTKIIAVTANIVKEDVVKYMKSGMNDYIIKPFKELELYRKLYNVICSGDKNINEGVQGKEVSKISLKKEVKNETYEVDDLLNATKGNALMFNKMLQTFLDNSKMALDQFTDSLKRKDWSSVREIAHRMVSSVKYFKMENLALELKEIEQMVVDNNVSNIESKIVSVTEQMDRMIKSLKNEML